ncbi:MAG: hypothetical protein WAV09_04330 [Minisyncoccia bacterium]
MTPRPYLSWSSLNTLEKSEEKWKEQYLYGEKMRINRGMAFGKTMADGLENDEATGDEILDMVITQIPKFELMDKVLEDENGVEVEYFDHSKKEFVKAKVPFIKDGKNKIPILVKIDSMNKEMTGFKEYKTSQSRWTKKMVNDDNGKGGQIGFYAMAGYLKTGKIPYDIELVEIETKSALDGKIEATGQIYRHHTVRTMGQILNMMVRAKKAWALINKICEEELL